MKKNLFLLAGICLLAIQLAVFSSCEKEEDGQIGCEGPTFKDLVVKNLDNQIFTNAPSSKISMLLKVETASGQPVADLLEKDFAIWEKDSQDECFENKTENAEVQIRIVQNPKRFHHSSMMVLDLSKSVTDNYFAELKAAALGFVNNVMPDTATQSFSIGIWWFDGSDNLYQLVPFTSNKWQLKQAISSLTPAISNSTTTDLYGAITKSMDVIELRLQDFQNQDIISGAAVAMFTDGNDQANRHFKSEAQTSVAKVKNAYKERLKLYAIGVGQQKIADLELIGKDGYAKATNKDKLEEVFVTTARGIRDEANSYYIFEFCSAARRDMVKIKIMATNPLNGQQGQYNGIYDSTGFEDLCQ